MISKRKRTEESAQFSSAPELKGTDNHYFTFPGDYQQAMRRKNSMSVTAWKYPSYSPDASVVVYKGHVPVSPEYHQEALAKAAEREARIMAHQARIERECPPKKEGGMVQIRKTVHGVIYLVYEVRGFFWWRQPQTEAHRTHGPFASMEDAISNLKGEKNDRM